MLALEATDRAATTVRPVAPPTSPRGGGQEQQIARAVDTALFHATSQRRSERRRETRHPFPNPVWLTPLAADGEPLVAETFVVLGRHLTGQGFDFFAKEPIAHTRVIASFPAGEQDWASLVLELSWCRFTRFGWYENGGRFLEATPSPLTSRSGCW